MRQSGTFANSLIELMNNVNNSRCVNFIRLRISICLSRDERWLTPAKVGAILLPFVHKSTKIATPPQDVWKFIRSSSEMFIGLKINHKVISITLDRTGAIVHWSDGRSYPENSLYFSLQRFYRATKSSEYLLKKRKCKHTKDKEPQRLSFNTHIRASILWFPQPPSPLWMGKYLLLHFVWRRRQPPAVRFRSDTFV